IESGKDTDILGSKANGERVEIRTGNDLNIASQQDIDNYNSKNSSSGGKIGTGGIGAQANVSKGRIDSKYASVTDQAGIYAGQGGFNITVGQNTDLKGAVIASEATPDKNLLSTGTLTYSDIQNKADYSASSVGVNYDSKKYSPTDKENYKNQGLTPNIGVTANGNADSTTKPAIANGTIDIRSNPNQDISGLSRETTNTLNALGKIFDKKTVQEQQELAQVFGEEAFKAIGDLGLKEGSPEKTALDAFTGGLMAKLGGGNFASGAAGAGFNQLIQNELGKIKDPAIHQWASAIVGAAAAKVVGGNAQTGASTAASETKNNYLTHWQEQQRDEAVANGDEDNVAYWNRVDETQETILNQFGISADFIEEYPSAQNILSTITTTVMSLQDEGLDPIAVLSNLSEAGQMFDNAKYGALIAAGIEFGNFSYANKLNHIFGKTEHNLGNFLSRYGGNQAEAFNVLQNAAQDQIISKGITGVFEEPIVVGEDIITVRGNVVDGVVKIGTAFIP
ncbi:MAG: hemagglutinin repeat-containing protein, partial [Veillonellales bacterium]